MADIEKNPRAETFNNTTGSTKANAYFIDMDNIGTGNATITCSDGTTFVLVAGASKTFATGTPMASMAINATGTIVQVIYTL